jgi:hypothetical protein
MTDTYDSGDGNLDRMATLPRKVVRRLEKEAQAGREAIARLEAMERESSFIKAGVPVDDPAAKYFVKGYEGEASPEAIKAAWDAAFGGRQTQTQGSQVEQELHAMEQSQQFAIGGGGTPPDQLAQRNAELAQLSPTDPAYPVKFDAIIAKYGGRFGDLHS